MIINNTVYAKEKIPFILLLVKFIALVHALIWELCHAFYMHYLNFARNTLTFFFPFY